MGLGTAGLLGGLGKGLVDLGVQKAKSQDQERFLKLEEAREIRLQQLRTQGQMDVQKLQGQQQVELEGKRTENDLKIEGVRGSNAAALEDKRQAGDAALKKSERESIEREGDKDRASREKIAGMRANPNGRNPPGGKFTTNTITATRVGEGGFPEQYDTLAVTRGGRTYVQLGDNFVPYSAGTPAALPQKTTKSGTSDALAPRAALEDLRKAPESAEEFLETFKYLPAAYISYLRGDASTVSTADDDE